MDWFAPGLVPEVRRAAPEIILCMGRMANCYAGNLQTAFPDAAVIATMRTGKELPARYRRSLAVARHVIANSRDARDTLVIQHAIPDEKISVIHNSLVFPSGASLDPSASSRETQRERLGASARTIVLLCVAMFRPEKNQRELIETVAALPSTLDWQLWLAGDGPARADCEQRVAAKQLSSRVKFLGFQRDPSAVYSAADVAVHASASEALSNFLIEAQAHGLPAVVYQAQGMEECFIPGETGWAIARHDRARFQSALVRLASDSLDTRQARSAAARAFARATFDPQRQAAAYLGVFQKLLTGPKLLCDET